MNQRFQEALGIANLHKVVCMADKSMYSRGGSGMTTGGLDDYLGPEAQDFSNLPEHIEEPAKVDEELRKMDCNNTDADEAVCKIAEAEKREAAKIAAAHR
jgi:hypothetical protein